MSALNDRAVVPSVGNMIWVVISSVFTEMKASVPLCFLYHLRNLPLAWRVAHAVGVILVARAGLVARPNVIAMTSSKWRPSVMFSYFPHLHPLAKSLARVFIYGLFASIAHKLGYRVLRHSMYHVSYRLRTPWRTWSRHEFLSFSQPPPLQLIYVSIVHIYNSSVVDYVVWFFFFQIQILCFGYSWN